MSTITLRGTKGSPLTNNEVDSNFSNLDNDKYEAGNDITSGDLSVGGELVVSAAVSVAASGSTQGTATALSSTYNLVTTASANQGVLLPDAISGKRCTVVNLTSADIKVYPSTSENIDNLAIDISKTLPAGATLSLIASSGTTWKSLNPVIIYDSSGTQLN